MALDLLAKGGFLRGVSSEVRAEIGIAHQTDFDFLEAPTYLRASLGGNNQGWNWTGEGPKGEDRLPILTCLAYGAGRRLGYTSLSQTEGSDATQSLFIEDAPLLNAQDWLLHLDHSASKRSSAQEQQQQRLDMVKDVLIKVLPDVSDIFFDASSGVIPRPTVQFKTPYGWVPLRQLGYGYRTMIAWIVNFASRMVERYPDSSDPLAEPAVVLVDEIDLHLHPKWQRELIGFLTERFPNTQFIVTAHSPLIVQAATDANIAVLKREGDHVVIENQPETIRGWRSRSSPDQRPLRPGDRAAAGHGKALAATKGRC